MSPEHISAFELAKRAQDAGLVVTKMAPMKCAPTGELEFLICLWTPEGMLWAEGTHESVDSVEQHIDNYVSKKMLGWWPRTDDTEA